jgi:hypothetical protein
MRLITTMNLCPFMVLCLRGPRGRERRDSNL